ncbi:aminopeptidase [Gaertneriomyces semiglobifer]|nr:aminopeptidase [Gaertneriomyces semiglobifer]
MRLTLLTLTAAFAATSYAQKCVPTTPDLPADKLSAALQRDVTLQGLLRHATAFQQHSTLSDGNRMFGSKGNQASIEYVRNLLEQTGAYDVSLEEFDFPYSELLSQKLVVSDKEYPLHFLEYAAASPAAGVTAEIVRVPDTIKDGAVWTGCLPEDFANVDVKGKIALIQRGSCAVYDKTGNAAKAGAIGALIYNQEGADPNIWPRLNTNETIPSAGLVREDGLDLIAKLEAGQSSGTLTVLTNNSKRVTHNVHAESKKGDASKLVHLGSHLDSVVKGPGINDNGSGSAAILEVALNVHKYNFENKLKFSWWGAEEFGLVGSEFYVEHLPQADRDRTKLYLNFDMIASPNYVIGVYDGDNSEAFPGGATPPAGSDAIEHLFNNYFESVKKPYVPAAFSGRSDYGPFIAVDIPSGGLFTGAESKKTEEEAKMFGGEAGVSYDICYHEACDTLDNLNHEAWIINAKAIAHATATYSKDLSTIPARSAAPALGRRAPAAGGKAPLDVGCGSVVV